MKKVRVTLEQAQAFDTFRKTVQRLGISAEELKDVFVYGYEVEPEFLVGDTVIHKETGVIEEVDGYMTTILEKHSDKYRHATPSEIAEEKERRWWKKHGREPWELRIGDVLQNKHTGLVNIIVVTGFEDGKPIFGHGNWHDYKRNYRIVCFAKDRLDVKTDD